MSVDQIVLADIEAYDPAGPGLRTLRYATRGFTAGAAPTVDPTLDPRLTVTRAGTATRFNSLGVMEVVAANTARYDYYPDTRALRGLLIEAPSTNYLLNSDIEGTVGATPTGMTWADTVAPVVSTDVFVGPNGKSAKHTRGSSGDNNVGTMNFTAQNGTNAASVYLYLPSSSSLTAVTINIEGTTFNTSASANLSIRDRWQRVLMLPTNGGVATSAPIVLRITGSAGAVVYSDAWQGEYGSTTANFSSYIPTTTGSVTRNADLVNMASLSPWYAAGEGTLYAEAELMNVGFQRHVVMLSDGTTSNRIGLYRALSPSGGSGFFAFGTQTPNGAAWPVGVVRRMALGFKSGDSSLAEDGAVTISNTATTAQNVTQMWVGASATGTVQYLGGWVRRIAYWRTRFPNATLASMSAGQLEPATPALDLSFMGNAHQHYEGRIQQAANLERSLFQTQRTTGRSRIGYGALVLTNMDGGLDGLLDLSFVGRRITISLGTVTASGTTWTTVLRGTMEQAELSWQRVTIKVRDRLLDIAKPIQQTRYAGNNVLPAGLEGVAGDLKGKPKPRVFGRVWNVAPPCVNTDRRIYQIHAGSALQSLGEVYDRGVPLTAGASYASQADMEANVPAANQYRLWNDATAGAFIRLGSAPTGLITVDAVQGAPVANRTVGQLFSAILTFAGIPVADINAADITALDAAAGYECGVYAGHKADVTPLQLLDELCASAGAWYAVDATGAFRLGRVAIPTSGSVGTLTATDILRVERVNSLDPGVGVPAWKVKVGYRRIYEVQDDLSNNVTDARKSFFQNEYRRVETSDAAVQTANLLAPEMEFLTVLSNESDANTEASRLLTLYKTRRDMYRVTVRVDAALAAVLDLGRVVTLQLPRFGLSAGKLFLIIGIETNMRNFQFDLTLWG